MNCVTVVVELCNVIGYSRTNDIFFRLLLNRKYPLCVAVTEPIPYEGMIYYNSCFDKFVHLVRAHRVVKKCYLDQQQVHTVTKLYYILILYVILVMVTYC